MSGDRRVKLFFNNKHGQLPISWGYLGLPRYLSTSYGVLGIVFYKVTLEIYKFCHSPNIIWEMLRVLCFL